MTCSFEGSFGLLHNYSMKRKSAITIQKNLTIIKEFLFYIYTYKYANLKTNWTINILKIYPCATNSKVSIWVRVWQFRCMPRSMSTSMTIVMIITKLNMTINYSCFGFVYYFENTTNLKMFKLCIGIIYRIKVAEQTALAQKIIELLIYSNFWAKLIMFSC